MEHIVMLPFLAQGHIIPFMALARKIQHRFGFTITLVSTPLNIAALKTTISNQSSSHSHHHIHLVSLPFDAAAHGLPPGTENTESVPLDRIIKLFHASTTLEPSFRRLIADIAAKDGRPPLCIVADVFTAWSVDVAADFGVGHLSFTTGGAYGTAAYTSVWQNLPHRSVGGEEFFTVPGFPDSCRFHVSQLHMFILGADGTDDWSTFFQPQLAKALRSSGWLCNSVEEIEPFGLDVLRKYTKLPVWCIGPLLQPKMLEKEKNPGIERCLEMEWLDSQADSSVVYISFGSQNSISPSQMMALAKGLEESGKPFLWVIRPPVGFDRKGEFRPEWLPEGFEERMAQKNQGLVVHKWAPQLEILSHKSLGAFLSHCGWNSIMESLSQGVPIIGWPIAAEQSYNSKMLVEDIGVGVEICRGLGMDLDKEDVKRILALVLDDDQEMKKKAVEIGCLIRDSGRDEDGYRGSSVRAMDDLVSFMLANKKV